MRHETAIRFKCSCAKDTSKAEPASGRAIHPLRRNQGRPSMADGKSLLDMLQKNVAVWLLSSLLVGTAALVIWWFASGIVVAIIKAFEVVIWLLGLMLWPFRL